MSAAVNIASEAAATVPAGLSAVPARPRVIITGSFPAFAAGLAAILRAEGFDAICRTEPEAACDSGHGDALLAILEPGHEPEHRAGQQSGPGQHIARLGRLARARDGLVFIAILVSPETADYVMALEAGAHAVLDWRASPAGILRALQAALTGHTVLPTPVARSLAHAAPVPAPAMLSQQEVRWLRLLAAGDPVAKLARIEGYSQREVFRRLAALYKRIGARNRPEAIALAARHGLLTSGEGQPMPAGPP